MDAASFAQILQTALHSPPRCVQPQPSQTTQQDRVASLAVSTIATTPPEERDAVKAANWLTHVREDQLTEEQLDFTPAQASITSTFTLDSLIAIAVVVVYENDVICQRVIRSANQSCLYTPAALHSLLSLSLRPYLA